MFVGNTVDYLLTTQIRENMARQLGIDTTDSQYVSKLKEQFRQRRWSWPSIWN